MPVPVLPSPHHSLWWLTKQGRNRNVSLPSNPPHRPLVRERETRLNIRRRKDSYSLATVASPLWNHAHEWAWVSLSEEIRSVLMAHFTDCGKLIVLNYSLSSLHVVLCIKSHTHTQKKQLKTQTTLIRNVTCGAHQLSYKLESHTSFNTPSYSPEVMRIHIQLAQNQWSLEFTVQKEAELMFAVIKQGGKTGPRGMPSFRPLVTN